MEMNGPLVIHYKLAHSHTHLSSVIQSSKLSSLRQIMSAIPAAEICSYCIYVYRSYRLEFIVVLPLTFTVTALRFVREVVTMLHVIPPIKINGTDK